MTLSLMKSRIVEAICILLTNSHAQSERTSSADMVVDIIVILNLGGQRRAYLSRWSVVLRRYADLCAWQLNESPASIFRPICLFLRTHKVQGYCGVECAYKIDLTLW